MTPHHEIFKNNVPENIQAIVIEILVELDNACLKHKTYPVFDKVHQAAIVAEEAGELVQAALQLTYQNATHDALRHEAIQTAAAAIRLLVHNKPGSALSGWIKEGDTQALPHTVTTGTWVCLHNMEGHPWTEGDELEVLSYCPSSNKVICQRPHVNASSKMDYYFLVDNFLPKQMMIAQ